LRTKITVSTKNEDLMTKRTMGTENEGLRTKITVSTSNVNRKDKNETLKVLSSEMDQAESTLIR
jgi:hypothetical protein